VQGTDLERPDKEVASEPILVTSFVHGEEISSCNDSLSEVDTASITSFEAWAFTVNLSISCHQRKIDRHQLFNSHGERYLVGERYAPMDCIIHLKPFCKTDGGIFNIFTHSNF